MELFDSGLNILLIILGFGMLIFVHELGHFLAAKWAGIRTEGFSIGFGPPICTWRKGIGFRLGSTATEVRQRTGKLATQLTDEELAEHGLGETEYALRWLPMGGFVKMLGQDDIDPASTSSNPRSFNMSSIGRRMVVISAGVVMNLLFAAVLFIIAFTIGVRFESPIIGLVAPGSPAALAVSLNEGPAGKHAEGLEPGDRILLIDDTPINTFGDLQIATAMGRPDVSLHMLVQRDGWQEPIQFEITPVKNEATGLLGIGVLPGSSTQLIDDPDALAIVQAELQRTGLAAQGVAPGMTMESIDGTSIWNWETYQSLSETSNGATQVIDWVQADEGGVQARHVQANLSPAPGWQKLRYVGASPEMSVGYEEGLLGLVPLVQIKSLVPGSPNEGILEPGDIILRIGSEQAPRMRTFMDAIKANGAGTISMSILRNEDRLQIEARVIDQGVFDPRPMIGVGPAYAWSNPRLARPMTQVEMPQTGEQQPDTIETPVAHLGLLGGSVVASVDGSPVDSWDGIWRGIHGAASRGDASVTLELQSPTPGQERRQVILPLDSSWKERVSNLGWEPALSFMYFEPLYTVRKAEGNPLRAVTMGLNETTKLVVLTYLTIDRLFRGTVGVEQLHGPLGIVHLGSKVADRGFTYLLFFLGLISVNLAVINFLPLPIVDGGLFLYLVYEKFKGRPPSVGFQNGAALVGLLLIATAFVVTFYNDILRIVG